jgi:hypothetical protein
MISSKTTVTKTTHLEETNDDDIVLLNESLGSSLVFQRGGRWASLLLQPVDNISSLTSS